MRPKKEEVYWQNARPRALESICYGLCYGEYSSRDNFGEQKLIFSEPIETDQITLIIRDVYEGTKYEDTDISEINFY